MSDAADELTAEVLRRLDAAPDPRLREVLRAAVRHLHGFAREVNLTPAEWAAGIAFLTAVGHTTTDERQEFILLSDTLGLSSFVETIAHPTADGATEATVLGPFHVPGAPWRANGDTIAVSDPGGTPALVRGTVRSTDGGPLAGAVLDVWQTASNGRYDVQDPEQPRGNMRGRFRTGADGSYAVRTSRPVRYAVPDDGPVGALLRASGRHPWRAAHLHVIVSADGHRPVTTHLFDAANEYLDSDTVFGVRGSLVKDFVPQPDGTLLVEHDFVLRPAGPRTAGPGPASGRGR
jgi:protocatechuate 3,4-dioxygenase beta subunit